jgi:oxygen-independent coproporphyrinogen-3 oxidase
MPAYEISNHATPESESRHNLIYWRMGDYIGIGPGAHGRLTLNGTRWATEALRNPNKWLNHIETDQTGEIPREAINLPDQATEYLLMSKEWRSPVMSN